MLEFTWSLQKFKTSWMFPNRGHNLTGSTHGLVYSGLSNYLEEAPRQMQPDMR